MTTKDQSPRPPRRVLLARRAGWLWSAMRANVGMSASMLVLVAGIIIVIAAAFTTSSPASAGDGGTAAPSRVAPISVTAAQTAIADKQVAAVRLDESGHRLVLTLTPDSPAAIAAKSGFAATTVPDATLKELVQAITAANIPLMVTNPSNAVGALVQGSVDLPANVDASGLDTSTTTAASDAHLNFTALGWVLIVAGLLSGGVFIARKLTKNDRDAAEHASAAATGPTPARAAVGGRGSKGTFEVVTAPETRFSDVAGCEEAVAELSELVMFLKDPDRFTRLGAKAPKGALLTGPPGTGKTLLARAVAGEAGIAFIPVSGSDFVEKYVGVGAKRVRELFAQARTHDKAIIFVDEVDAVGRRRGYGSDSHIEGENTLNALLTEMDGFTASNVVVLAATNRPDILDPALRRPGRLDRTIQVPNPDRRGREQILTVHSGDKPLGPDVDLVELAARTPGFSGAELAAVVNEACIDAVRRGLDEVTQSCLTDAVATTAMGRARTSAVVTEHDREVTAWHEAGHTLAAYLQADGDDPAEVTIIPRGPAGGVTWIPPNDDMFLTRRKAHARLVTAMGGRVGEELLLDGEFTQGAGSDLANATDLAQRMVTQYGMSRLGLQVREPSTLTSAKVEKAVEDFLNEAYQRATTLLSEHRHFLATLAGRLLERDSLTYAQIHQVALDCGVARHAVMADPVHPWRLVAAPAAVDGAGRDAGADAAEVDEFGYRPGCS